jgi:hypothetical protein
MKIMAFTNETFYKLLKTIKAEEDSTLDNFGVVMKVDGYIIECYRTYDNDDIFTDEPLNFDTCGSIVFGKYEDMTLTDYQYKLLDDKFNKLRTEWLNEYDRKLKEESIDTDFNGDYYDYYGVNRAMFI